MQGAENIRKNELVNDQLMQFMIIVLEQVGHKFMPPPSIEISSTKCRARAKIFANFRQAEPFVQNGASVLTLPELFKLYREGQLLQIKVQGLLRVKVAELLNRIIIASSNLLLAHNFACL